MLYMNYPFHNIISMFCELDLWFILYIYIYIYIYLYVIYRDRLIYNFDINATKILARPKAGRDNV